MKLKDKQILHKYIHRDFEEKEVTVIEKQEDGSEKKVLETKKIPVEKEFVFKLPNRLEMEDLEMFYSIKVNEFVKKGLMTKDMIMKQYLDNGGELSDKEQMEYLEKSKELFEVQNEYYLIASKDEKTEIEEKREEELFDKIYILRRELVAFEEIKNNIFNHTADNKARNKTILYCILFFTYEKGEDEDFKSFFKGRDFDGKQSSFYQMEDNSFEEEGTNESILFKSIFDRMSTVALFYFLHNITDRKEMDDAINDLNKQSEREEEFDNKVSEGIDKENE